MEVRCPQCHSPIDLANDSPLSDIVCPSCGSGFGLLADETTTHQAVEATTIGHFQLMDQIGVGSFGSVWKSRDTELDRTVAVKIPRKGQLSPSESELFLREARAAAQLKHPNIVSVHEVGREQDTVYMVSDYVDGLTLADWLTDQRSTCPEAAELCVKVADALHHAHEAGVVHRDLKPSNIILDAGREPHVTDFGLAKREAGEVTMTMEGRVLGTPAYTSPEQAKGEAHQADRRSDVYSLGVILFELLTLERPFRGNMGMLLHHVIHDDAPSPRKLNSSIPRDLETICLKCLEKEPNKRYQTARELGEELRRFLRGEPIRARPITALARGGRWCRRNPTGAAVALLLLFLAIASPIAAIKQTSLANREKVNLYFHRITLTNHELANRRPVHALRLLRQCPPNLRGWEWQHLHRLCYTHPGPLLELSPRRVLGIALSPVGQTMAIVTDDGNTTLFDLASGKVLSVLPSRTLAGVKDTVNPVFSCDGTVLATPSDDNSVILWNTATWEQLGACIKHNGTVRCVAFSPGDKNRLATAGDDMTIKLWTLRGSSNCELVHILQKHRRPITSVQFSHDGRRLASGSFDYTVRIWDATTGTPVYSLRGHLAPVSSVAFSPVDGNLLVSGSFDHTVRLWDMTSKKEVSLMTMAHAGGAACVAFTRDGKRIVSGGFDRALRFWETVTGREVLVVREFQDAVSSVAFSPSDHRLFVGGHDGTVTVYDGSPLDERRVRKALTLERHTSRVRAVTFDPMGDHLASAGEDGKVVLGDVAGEEKPITFDRHKDVVFDVVFSPDGRLAASSGGTDGAYSIMV